jgi:hypothetical protein
VLDFAIPAGVAVGTAVLASDAIAHAVPGVTAQQARTASLLAAFAMGLWILALIALPPPVGQSATPRIVLIVVMAACLAGLFAIPAARRILALEPPPPSVLGAEAAVIAVAICALALWRARPHFPRK